MRATSLAKVVNLIAERGQAACGLQLVRAGFGSGEACRPFKGFNLDPAAVAGMARSCRSHFESQDAGCHAPLFLR